MHGQIHIKDTLVFLDPEGLGKKWYKFDRTIPPIGSGAMGMVFKGIDCSTGESVAIKKISERFCRNQEIRHRAHLEAKLKFSHPNLVEMLGYCEIDNGPIFIISRFVVGENIDTFINKNIRELPNPEKRICELFFPVLDALSFIHSKNIIHMDIKPSNIMMEKGNNVRLMDLGVADVSQSSLSASSGLMGTPRYAAPEQFSVKGVSEKPILTPSTDIYEAGVTLYELITGTNPFSSVTIADAKHKHETLILPLHHKLSLPVYEVLKKATIPLKEKRYQSASEMKQDLFMAINKVPKQTKPFWIYGLIAVLVVLAVILVVFVMLLN